MGLTYILLGLVLGRTVQAVPDFLSAPHVAAFDTTWGTTSPSVGISVVTYGRPMFLDFALQQIRWQTMQPREVVRDFETAAKRTHETPAPAGCN